MKVYQAFYQSASDATCCHWGSTKTEARAAAQVAAFDDSNVMHPLRSFQTVEHKIEPGADGLCKWLNTKFTRDNG
jgi:hypothetical protein